MGQISVAMERCPTMTKDQFHGPSLQYTYVLSLPPLPPAPSRLVTVPASHLEKDWQYEVILCISDHCLEGLCSAVLQQVVWVGCLVSALRPERDMGAAWWVSRKAPHTHHHSHLAVCKCYSCCFHLFPLRIRSRARSSTQ